jgi:hypothetical protein
MGGSLLGIGIVLLIGAVIVGAAVVFLVAAIVRWRDRIRVPSCGACRYPVEGLSTFTCPECGADLRGVGILVPGVRAKHRVHVAEKFAAWAVVALFGGLITSSITAGFSGAQRMSFSRSEVLTSVAGGLPQISVTASGTASQQSSAISAPAQRLLVQTVQTRVATPIALHVDLAQETWRIASPPGVAPAKQVGAGRLPLRDEDVAAWLVAAGAVQDTGRMAGEVSALASYVNNGGRLSDSLSFSAVSGGSGMTIAPARWVFASSAGAWMVIFVIGCVLIAKAHSTKRPRREAHIAESA